MSLIFHHQPFLLMFSHQTKWLWAYLLAHLFSRVTFQRRSSADSPNPCLPFFVIGDELRPYAKFFTENPVQYLRLFRTMVIHQRQQALLESCLIVESETHVSLTLARVWDELTPDEKQFIRNSITEIKAIPH